MKLTVPGSASPVLDNQTASKFSCGKTAPADHPSSSHAPSAEFYYNDHIYLLNLFLRREAPSTNLDPFPRCSAHDNTSLPEETLRSLCFCEHYISKLDLRTNSYKSIFCSILQLTCLDPNFSWFLSSHAWSTYSF